MSARNPLYDQPTAAERAAREQRERERIERVTRPGPIETAISSAFSSAAEWVSRDRSETDQQRSTRLRREAEARRVEEDRIQARIARDNQERLVNLARQWQRAGRPLNAQLAAALAAANASSTSAETTRTAGEPGTPTRASLAGTSGTGNAAAGTGNAAAPPPAQERSAAERSSDLRANNVTFRSASTPLADSAVANSASSVTRMGRDVFNISRFRGNVSASDSVLPNHSFLVTFAPMDWVSSRALREDIHSLLTMRCENAVLPSINLLQEQNIRRYGYGPVENVAYGVNVGDFTLQFIVDKDAAIIDFFEAWLNRIVNRDSYGGADMNSDSDVYLANYKVKPYEIAYKDSYACSSVNVFVYDRAQNTVLEYNIYDVFPTGIQSMNMSWSEENSLMKLNVTFSFTDFRIRAKVSAFNQAAGERNGMDTNPRNSLPPVQVVTLAGEIDVPVFDPSSITIPVSELSPVVIGDSGVPRSFGVPRDTGPITATTPDVPTATIRDAFGQENIIA